MDDNPAAKINPIKTTNTTLLLSLFAPNNLEMRSDKSAKMVNEIITLQNPGISRPGKKSNSSTSLLISSVTKLKKTTTNKMGIKWLPTHVCLNFTPGMPFMIFRIRGS